MARTKRDRRSYSAGEWGRNRVTVFADPKTGLYQHRVAGERAQAHPIAEAPRLGSREGRRGRRGPRGPQAQRHGGSRARATHPGTAFEIYGEEVTPTKAKRTRGRDRVAMRMFLGFLGPRRRPETLSQRDWDRFIRERRAGTVGPSGKPVSNRMIECDLRFLIAVLNWASRSRDERGRLLIQSNPLRGLRKMPRQKNPTRIVLSDEEYRALLNGAGCSATGGGRPRGSPVSNRSAGEAGTR